MDHFEPTATVGGRDERRNRRVKGEYEGQALIVPLARVAMGTYTDLPAENVPMAHRRNSTLNTVMGVLCAFMIGSLALFGATFAFASKAPETVKPFEVAQAGPTDRGGFPFVPAGAGSPVFGPMPSPAASAPADTGTTMPTEAYDSTKPAPQPPPAIAPIEPKLADQPVTPPPPPPPAAGEEPQQPPPSPAATPDEEPAPIAKKPMSKAKLQRKLKFARKQLTRWLKKQKRAEGFVTEATDDLSKPWGQKRPELFQGKLASCNDWKATTDQKVGEWETRVQHLQAELNQDHVAST